MFNNWGQLRALALDLRATESTGDAFNQRLRRAFSLAYNKVVGDVPKAFTPEMEHFVLYEDVTPETTVTSANTARYLRRTSDGWVLEFTSSTGAVYPAPQPAGAWIPEVDGTWDGIMHLEITDTNGEIRRHQSREWWYFDNDLGRHFYVSLDRPYSSGSTSENLTFRIFMPEIYLSASLIQVVQPLRLYSPSYDQIYMITAENARRFSMPDYQGDWKGRPQAIWRGRRFQIQSPNKAPVAAAKTGDPSPVWAGPENRGTFRFLYTRVWGVRPSKWQESPSGNDDPMWESAPSPTSTAFQHTGADATAVIRITVPEIDYMQNFGFAGDLRYGRTGYRTRIYVARDDIVVGAPGSHPQVEEAGIFYLLDEIDGSETTYDWDGSTIPDYFRRISHSTGYFAYEIYPHQDDEYELDINVLKIPDILIDDQDTPNLQVDCHNVLLEAFLYYLCQMDGVDDSGAKMHLDNYNDEIRKLRKKYGNAGGVVLPRPIATMYRSTRLASNFELI